MKLSILFNVILIILQVNIGSSSENNNSFVATNEWQEIKEGQAIPKGLHVRINLQTGKKDAKLIDDKKSHSSSLSTYNSFEIKNNVEDYQEPMKYTYSSDNQIIDKLMEDYKNSMIDNNELKNSRNTTNNISVILDEFEYLLHQENNAIYFVNKNGLETIIYPNINQTRNIEYKLKSLIILGTLTQNNPNVQINVFNRNAGLYLLKLLNEAPPKYSNDDLIVYSLFAYGSLIKNFPYAQYELFHKGGFQILIDILLKPDNSFKIKIKTLTLINDLVEEYNYAIKDEIMNKEKMKEYILVDIINLLNKTTQYCYIIDELFIKNKDILLKDTTLNERFIDIINTSKKLCIQLWAVSPMFRHTLLVLKNGVNSKIQDNEQPDDKDDKLLKNIEQIYSYLYANLNYDNFKEEL